MQSRGMEAGLQILLHIVYISLQQEIKAHKRQKIKGSTKSTTFAALAYYKRLALFFIML